MSKQVNNTSPFETDPVVPANPPSNPYDATVLTPPPGNTIKEPSKDAVRRISYLDLADFMGLSLKVEAGNKLSGKDTVMQNWGLAKMLVKQEVFSSQIDLVSGIWMLMVAGPGDLGFLIDYEAQTKQVQISIVDRSMLAERGKNLFEDKPGFARLAVSKKAIKATFTGQIRGEFELDATV